MPQILKEEPDTDQLEQPDADQPDSAQSSGATAASQEVFPSSRQMTWFIAALLVYFAGRLIFFAVTISPYVPPDEATHFGKCLNFSHAFFLPENSPESHQFGLVTNIAWLYFWIMGKLLHLNFFGFNDLTFLRLLNIPFAFGTVYYVWRLFRLLSRDRLAQILLIAALTNTLMFSFVSASVSYDNLTNLLAAAAIYYLFGFLKGRSGTMLAASILCQLAGCLTKITFLPLAAALTAVLLVHEISGWRGLPGAFKGWFRASRAGAIALSLAILVGLTLNVGLYGGNYLRYRVLEPQVYQVLPLEQALQYRLAARAYILGEFRDGRITGEKATEMAITYIKNPGDRDDTIGIVKDYAYLEKHQDQMFGPFSYAAIWVLQMLGSTFGIKAHLGMLNYSATFWLHAVLILLAGIAFGMRWRPRPWSEAWLPGYLAAIVAFYGYVLMYVINYGAYLTNRDLGVTLAGRYIFPVLGPIYVLSSYYLLRLCTGRRMQLGIFLAALLIFVVSDFPFFLTRVTPAWYDWTAR